MLGNRQRAGMHPPGSHADRQPVHGYSVQLSDVHWHPAAVVQHDGGHRRLRADEPEEHGDPAQREPDLQPGHGRELSVHGPDAASVS